MLLFFNRKNYIISWAALCLNFIVIACTNLFVYLTSSNGKIQDSIYVYIREWEISTYTIFTGEFHHITNIVISVQRLSQSQQILG